MSDNESIIAVPTTIEQPGQLRQFLVRMVTELDTILGFRGPNPSISDLQTQITELEARITRLERQ